MSARSGASDSCASAVVDNFDSQQVWIALNVDIDPGRRASMFDDVRQRFLHHSIGGQLDA
jgi:hypothetical protein